MKNDSIMSKMFDSMIPAMTSQMPSQLKDSVAKAKYRDIMKVSFQTAKGFLPEMMNDMALIYDEHFTQKEIQDLIVFYKSPTGQKFLNQSPEIMKESMGKMMKKYVPEIQKAVMAKIEEYKKADKKQNKPLNENK